MHEYPQLNTVFYITFLESIVRRRSQKDFTIQHGCDNEVVVNVGPSRSPTSKDTKQNSTKLELSRHQVLISVKGVLSVLISRKTDHISKNFLEISLKEIYPFWESKNNHSKSGHGN